MTSGRKPITRDDLTAAFRGIVDDSHDTVVDAGAKAAGLAGALAFLTLAVTYILGRRKGAKARSVVEVRRI